ncbi:MBL fold metallo-hydrolase [Glaciibacter sp. 2TAF33]|uniref:MBL fold metallo-hydrolase n=1 Tax=Glaciibacter sp. 2TAF33 TaxID=3233015 RepID=UPI003F8E94FE
MMIPTSAAQFAARVGEPLPGLEKVTDGVWSLPLRIPPGHMPYTLSYLIEDSAGGIHLVDPGSAIDDNVAIIQAALAEVQPRSPRLASMIATHLHPDHLGLAELLRSMYGAPILFHAREQRAQITLAERAADDRFLYADLADWGVPADRVEEVAGFAKATPRPVVMADALVGDGDWLDVPGRRIQVLHTPGHTPGHVCLHDTDAQLLFVGDHVLPTVVPGIGLGGPTEHNPLEGYLAALGRVAALDDCEVLPGHGYRFRGVAERAAVTARHHLNRTAEVADVLAESPEATTWEIASRLRWSRGWAGLTRHYLVAALRQTAMHARLVHAGGHARVLALWGQGEPGPTAISVKAG